MEPLSTVFLPLNDKTKEALDRKKIGSYQELLLNKNKPTIHELNIPIDHIKEHYDKAKDDFRRLYSAPYPALEYMPKSHTSIISCIIAPSSGQIIEITGEKSAGKTCVLLEIASRFMKENPQRSVFIISACSGVTHFRLKRLPFDRVNYRDVYNLTELHTLLDEAPEKSVGMILIDGLLKLVKTLEKPKEEIKIIFKKLSDSVEKHNLKYVVENSTVSDRVDLDSRHSYNSPSEFSWVISNCSHSRVLVCKASGDKYRVVLLKSLFNCTVPYHSFQINELGYIDK